MNWEIERITEATTLDPGTTRFVRLKLIQYTVGKPGDPPQKRHGPFQIEIPAEDFTSERVKLRLDQELAHFQQLFPQA